VLGERSGGAGWKRFPGERRTLTCSLYETKYQVDRARHEGTSLIASEQAALHTLNFAGMHSGVSCRQLVVP